MKKNKSKALQKAANYLTKSRISIDFDLITLVLIVRQLQRSIYQLEVLEEDKDAAQRIENIIDQIGESIASTGDKAILPYIAKGKAMKEGRFEGPFKRFKPK